jgi:hypothetical protein
VLLAESCNIALAEVTKPDIKVLTLGRLAGADQGYFRGECIETGVWPAGRQGAAIDIAANWGGGPVRRATGCASWCPVRTLNAGPNPKYFVPTRGVTWLNVVSDRATSLGGLGRARNAARLPVLRVDTSGTVDVSHVARWVVSHQAGHGIATASNQ